MRYLLKMIVEKTANLLEEEVVRKVNDLLIVKWLSQSLSNPEFFGILPKHATFNETHKQIFFGTS